jgi:drug/metabolite transporter (DMT)-like permease
VIKGVLLGFAAYAMLAWGDGIIKGLGTRLSIFEIGLVFSLAALAATYFMRPKDERWRDVFRMRHPWLVQARALTGITAGFLGVYAFLTIPFAEAYALIFMAPFVVMLLSVLLLGERIGWRGFVAMAAGFAGVLLVIQPGLRAIEIGHFTAMGAAIAAALTVIILRRIGRDEKRTSLLGIPQLYALGVSVAGTAVQFVTPTLVELAMLVVAGLLGALGQFALLSATRRAPANAVGQTQYSQLIWAVTIGALFYAEYPNWLAITGLVVIGAAGLMTIAEQRARGRDVQPPPADTA